VYNVRYRTTVADTYDIRLVVQGEPLPVIAPNHQCLVHPAALSPARSTVKGAVVGMAGAQAGAVSAFFVTPRDTYGNVRTGRVDQITVTVRVDGDVSSDQPSSGQLTPESGSYVGGAGIAGVATADDYRVTLRPVVAGSMMVGIMLSGGGAAAAAAPAGAPFVVAVAAGATSAPHSRITGRWLAGAAIAQSRDVFIQARDRYDNPTNRHGDTFVADLDITTAPEGAMTRTLLIVREDPSVTGQYILSYTLPVMGTYTVVVALKDRDTGITTVVGAAAAVALGSTSVASPLTLVGRGPAGDFSPAASGATGLDGDGVLVCGVFTELMVETRDAAGFPVTVGGRAFTLIADGQVAQMGLNRDNNDGTYTLSFTAPRPGPIALHLYLTTQVNSLVSAEWTVLVGGALAWPKSVVFRPGPTDARRTTAAWDTDGGASSTVEAGVVAVAVVTARDQFGNTQVYGPRYRTDTFTAVARLAGGGGDAALIVVSLTPGRVLFGVVRV